jgi:hypothetical protein
MKKVIVLLIAMLLIGLNSATADETKNWEITLNEFISTITIVTAINDMTFFLSFPKF